MQKGGETAESARVRLARLLRAIRAEHGISQETPAPQADLHRTCVGAIERMERNVSLDNIERLARALGVDLRDLLAPAARAAARAIGAT